MKRWDRDMRRRDLNFIILGRVLHKNEVSFIFENFNPNDFTFLHTHNVLLAVSE
jgi:hypothetical protein